MFIDLFILGIAAFVQNMAFTWTSRSRNSGDPNYHRWAAMCSNGIWLICHFLVWKQIWTGFETGQWWRLVIAAVVYIFATTEGSVLMMKILLKKEKGKHRVGARKE
jgi:hypothetical protein